MDANTLNGGNHIMVVIADGRGSTEQCDIGSALKLAQSLSQPGAGANAVNGRAAGMERVSKKRA